MKKLSLFITAAVLATGCNDNNKKTGTESSETEKVTMEDTEQNREDRDLFNGEDLNGWKVYNAEGEATQWSVEDGSLAFAPSQGQRTGTENLITEDEYTNFELSL